MTEITGRDLIRHEIPDPFDPITARRRDHDRLARRVGDAERTATCEALAEHFAAGRLSGAELENRLGWAVRAVTEDELRQLVADLPRIPAPPAIPGPSTPVGGGPSWPATVVIAVVALIVAGCVAGGMLMVLGAVNPLLFVGACLGGTAALVAGASAGYLVTRSRRP